MGKGRKKGTKTGVGEINFEILSPGVKVEKIT